MPEISDLDPLKPAPPVDFQHSPPEPLGASHPSVRVRRFDEMYRSFQAAKFESGSGPGSSLAQTAEIRRQLPQLLKKFRVQSLLDLPCGDLNWMHTLDLGTIDYIGGDFLPHVIEQNRGCYANSRRRFMQLDLLQEDVPKADLILCRDCLVHFSFEDISIALQAFKRSGSRYLLTTTFTSRPTNADIATGGWRPLNLEAEPFCLPQPEELIVENCTEGAGWYADKSLGLWSIPDLPV